MRRVARLREDGPKCGGHGESNGRIGFLRPGRCECDGIATAIRSGEAHLRRRIAGEQRSERVRIGRQLCHRRDTPSRVGVEMGLGTKEAFGDHGGRCDARIAHPRDGRALLLCYRMGIISRSSARVQPTPLLIATAFSGPQKTRPCLPFQVDRVAGALSARAIQCPVADRSRSPVIFLAER